eukprot:g26718.t1
MTIRCPGCKSNITVPEIDKEPEPVGASPAVAATAAAVGNAPPAMRSLAGWDDDDDDEGGEDDEEFALRAAATDFEEMDLTPMVDVTFLLLIFFMITASFTIQKTLQFPPPEKNEEGASMRPVQKDEYKEDSVLVDIDENGGITVAGELVADPSALVAAIENARAEGSQIKDSILITRHYFCPHDTSVRVVDAAKEAKIQKILIATEPGDVEERELSKTQPVSIGRHSSNDIRIDEEDVGVMHCRIAWNKNAFELVAASPDGVELNGTSVKNAVLETGDILRVGTVDIEFTIDEKAGNKKREPQAAAAAADSASSGSAQLPDELFDKETGPVDAIPSGSFLTPDASEDDGFFEDEDAEDDLAEQPVLNRSTKFAENEEGDKPAEAGEEGEDGDADKGQSLRARMRESLDRHAVRPGEHDVLRSKILYVLGIGSGVLLLVSAVLWFWTVQNTADKLREQAEALHQERKWGPAIETYEKFLQDFPNNERTTEVKFKLGRARIEQHFNPDGRVTDPEAALEAVEKFIEQYSELEGYSEEQKKLTEDVKKIATGAAELASKTKQRKFLPMAKKAETRARLLKAGDEFLAKFKARERKAVADVEKEENVQEAIKKITAAFEAGDTMKALQLRIEIFDRYKSVFAPKNLRTLNQLLVKALDKEASMVVYSEINRDAETKDRPERARKPLSLTYHVRPQDGRTSDKTQLAIGLAKQCCYGIDTITGEPVWRRAIGEMTPFFPLKLDTKVPALLLFDTQFGELALINRQNGQLIWRQPLRTEEKDIENLLGEPLVHDGLIYVPTASDNLYKLDLDSGRLLSKLKFTQPINAPPALVLNGTKLVVAGDKAILYTVALTPKMACEAASYTGHKTGTVVAPLRSIGKLLLMCENDRADSCRLRVLNSTAKNEWLAELTSTDPAKQVRVPGIVRDKPVLRNNELFVASTGETITKFSVSDDDTKQEAERTADQFLRRLATTKKEKSTYDGPVYLVAGPNGLVWTMTDQLVKFQSSPSTIQRDTDTARGRATQPPQVVGNQFYLGRQTDFSTAVTFTQTDREVMEGRWRVVLGSSILEWSAADGKPIVCVNENGHVFRVQPNEVADGGFLLKYAAVTNAQKAIQPFRAFPLGDGSIGVSVGAEEESSLWVINASAQIIRTIPIPAGLQTDPVVLPRGVVLPLPGRLKLVSLKPGQPRVEDFELTVAAGNQPKWKFLTRLGDQIVAADDRGGLAQAKKKQPAKKKPPAKKQPDNLDDDDDLVVYPKLEDMQVPSVKELFEQEPRCWVVLKNQDVIIAQPVNPRPDTLKKIQARIDRLKDTRPPPPGPERDKFIQARRDAPFLPVSVFGPGDNPEKVIHISHIDQVIHHEDLQLRRIGMLQDAGELELSYSLLFNLKRNRPTWPTIAHYENRQLFTEARERFKANNPISALFRLERIHTSNSKFAGLKQFIGEVADRLITDAINQKDYRRARHYIGRLRRREPDHSVYQKWKSQLEGEAGKLLEVARNAAKAKKHEDAATAAMAAVNIWPATPGLRGAYDAMTRRFQTLNVGVISFSGENPAYFLPTEADRREKYLTQTSMFEAKGFTFEPTHDDVIHYQTRYFSEWEPKDLGRQILFKLRAQREYFDPQPAVTSSSIASTLRARLDPKGPHYDERLASYVKSFTVHSPTELEIRFSRVPARVESVLNFPLIRPARRDDKVADAKGTTPVSVGGETVKASNAIDSPRFTPYRPVEWTDSRRAYRRFIPEPEDVPENRYHVGQVVEHKFKSYEEAIQALKRGKIQMLAHVRPWEVDLLKKDDRFDVRQYALPTTHVLQFNPESDTLKSREVRRALRYALDREDMLRKIALRLEGDPGPSPKGRVISSPFPSNNYATKLGIKPMKHDLVLALALKVVMSRAHERVHHVGLGSSMAMAITPTAEKEGWMPTLRMLIPPGDIVRGVAEKCVETWDRIGIKVVIVTQAPGKEPPQWDIMYRTIKMVDPVVDLWPFLTFDDRARVESLTHLPDWLRQELIRLDVARDWAQVTRSLGELHEHMQLQALMIPLFEVDDYLAIRNTISAFRDPRLRVGGSGYAQSEKAAAKKKTEAAAPVAVKAEQKPKRTKKEPKIPIEMVPYRVRISVAFADEPGITPAFRERVLEEIAAAVPRSYGQMWTLDLRTNDWIPFGSSAGLEQVNAENLVSRFLPSEPGARMEFDKLFLMTVERHGRTFTVSGREFDAKSRKIGPVESDRTTQPIEVGRKLFLLLPKLFHPVLQIERVGPVDVDLRLQAASFPANDPAFTQLKVGDILVPYFRYLDKFNTVQKFRNVSWTYVAVEKIEGQYVTGSQIMDRMGRLGTGRTRGVEIFATVVRPRLKSSRLKMVYQSDETKPLVGYNVQLVSKKFYRDKAASLPLKRFSGRDGIIDVPVIKDFPIVWVYVYSGGALLARVPYMPGVNNDEKVALPDDSIRLGVEGKISLLKGEVIDTVARRATLMALAKQIYDDESIPEAKRATMIVEKRDLVFALPGVEEYSKRIGEIRRDGMDRATSQGNRFATRKIKQICDKTDKLIAKFLDKAPVQKYFKQLEDGEFEKKKP